jgi:hypothetical protein
MKIALIALIASATAIAQAPAQPTLSRPIQLQLKTLSDELVQVQKDFAAVNGEVAKENPGWHLSPQLQIEKDSPKPETAPVKPAEPKK